jgi:hypothetical protein
MSSVRRTTSSGLVVVGVIELIVPLIMALVLGTISVLAMVLDPITSVPITDDVLKISYSLTLATLIWRM